MRLPNPRGDISEALFNHIHAGPGRTQDLNIRIGSPDRALADEDLQIALWSLYELHYRSFDDIDDNWEWDPRLLAARAKLEEAFEAALRETVLQQLAKQPIDVRSLVEPGGDFAARFFDLVADFEAPDVAKWVQSHASRNQILDFLIGRSIYSLKEADPHTWVIPRIAGAAKSALVELQFDEYGGGRVGRTHAELYETTMREAGLDPTYGAYVDDVGAATLAANNVLSLFGLHRRHRGTAMGHLAAFEATSSLPSRRYAAGLRRTGFSDLTAEYFDEHVEADAVHEQLAVRAICARLIKEEPKLENDIMFGALSCLVLDARIAAEIVPDTCDRAVAPPSLRLVENVNA